MSIKGIVFDAYGTLYDVQTVSAVTDKAFPGFGDYITQVWRMKQLEYTWLRTMMGDYQDFWACTRDALSYTLKTIGLTADQKHFDEIAEAYNNLKPYPDAKEALMALQGYRLAILSNGSPGMLDALTRNSGLDKHLETWISVDPVKAFKPDMRAYEPVHAQMGLARDEVLFVSSNGFDVCGAKRFGFRVARIERVTPKALNKEIRDASVISPSTMFKATRMRIEDIGHGPDHVVASLKELPTVLETMENAA
ncbi:MULTISPECIES: haloacid dehalogenase type II [Afipia]|uniref:(S)-2-haloacid dehalogenase n=2 Tax=Afipia felis TaxID=1035 RepID=A0A380W385_AFIFE|nr:MULTISPECIES: haloacid dehalogenase type II [Afipia]EFI53292.1 haloacid dehalogenase, type II [Afipia sp. 1NLS2]EKS30519.1 haloacid dehalogenase, type II [Afipia felis ATCC 53690]SUU75264.1 (S)-2-haloacid dehalogenase [Afipia felis]SUU83330.1 (S)-2-haloacid dehalogenase [Afipia felis]